MCSWPCDIALEIPWQCHGKVTGLTTRRVTLTISLLQCIGILEPSGYPKPGTYHSSDC